MPTYRYRARDAQGRAVSGSLEGLSGDAVARQLGSAGMVPIDIVEATPARALGAAWLEQWGVGRPGRVDMILFTRQMYALARAGVPITQALRRLSTTSRNPQLGRTLGAVMVELEAGRDMATALSRHPKTFGPLFAAIVRVGEESGRIDEAFLRLNQHLEREQKVVEQVKTAVRYPIIVLAFVAVAIFMVMTLVIPEFAKLYGAFDVQLPLPTRIIIGTSNFFAAWWWLVLGVAVGSAWWLRRYVQSEAGRLRWHGLLLKLPIIGSIVLRATLARFARAFAMATRSGVPVLQALTVVALAVENDVLARQLLGMRGAIERGESLTRAAATQACFTPLVLQMLSVGEETGRIDEMLVEVADFYEREVDYDVRNLNDLLQPVLTVLVAGVVFLLALGVLLPMWDLVNLARR
ncbi:MAG TPA: MSHA biogenesis protein MshG [Xanthomonadaceae bacterium]|nr:MSHA biogenesis protein MshG [Xanthomonadaceae bacterium]